MRALVIMPATPVTKLTADLSNIWWLMLPTFFHGLINILGCKLPTRLKPCRRVFPNSISTTYSWGSCANGHNGNCKQIRKNFMRQPT